MISRKRERSEQTSHKVIEKRRRDRINSCLAELSQAVPSIFAKQTSGKLEKAEILEMTVKYLRVLQRCGIAGRFETGSETKFSKLDGMPNNQYNAGFNDCLKEVIRYLTEVEGITPSDEKYQKIVHFLLTRQETEQVNTNEDYYRKFTNYSNAKPPKALHVTQPSSSMMAYPLFFDSRYTSEVSPQHPQCKCPIEIRAPPELIISEDTIIHEPSPLVTELPPLRATPTLWRPFPVNAHAIRHVQRQLFQPHPMYLIGNKTKTNEISPSCKPM
ncbi:uncharacterized protein [Antedon mediterranea]|uniref:uncharacterized protein n=1 Tax=Antedon mediterranea TaxID=105859 RepID=UPI003AF4A9D4